MEKTLCRGNVLSWCQRLVAHGRRILNMCCSTQLSTLDGSRVSLFFISRFHEKCNKNVADTRHIINCVTVHIVNS